MRNPHVVMMLSVLLAVGTAQAGPDAASGSAEQPSTALADQVDAYRSSCIAPFFADQDESAVIKTMASASTAEALLARLAKGAPKNWQPLADKTVPIAQRLQGALGLLGMAISHGSAYEKQVAAAYSVEYLPIPQTQTCQRPDGLHEFVQAHDFWAPPANTN